MATTETIRDLTPAAYRFTMLHLVKDIDDQLSRINAIAFAAGKAEGCAPEPDHSTIALFDAIEEASECRAALYRLRNELEHLLPAG